MRTSLWAVAAILVIGASASAQETRGKILGTVQDAQGAVPGATVKITNVDTKTSTQAVTNAAGYFEAPLLQLGTYDVRKNAVTSKAAVRSAAMLVPLRGPRGLVPAPKNRP
jgi:hypothetical protein